MQRLIMLSAGFLLAVLWFDLMFDVQVVPYLELGMVAEGVLDSISTYYRRVTTDAAPMPFLVGGIMLVAGAAVIVNLIRGRGALWNRSATAVLMLLPVIAARIKVLPDARLLGEGLGDQAARSALALDIFWLHAGALVVVLAAVVLQFLPSATRKVTTD
jgi:hypothetical protein